MWFCRLLFNYQLFCFLGVCSTEFNYSFWPLISSSGLCWLQTDNSQLQLELTRSWQVSRAIQSISVKNMMTPLATRQWKEMLECSERREVISGAAVAVIIVSVGDDLVCLMVQTPLLTPGQKGKNWDYKYSKSWQLSGQCSHESP